MNGDVTGDVCKEKFLVEIWYSGFGFLIYFLFPEE